jgi:Ca-activated chloride channel family protein
MLMLLQEAPVFRSDVKLVTVPCQVTDSNGAAVTNLNREDFRLFDNGAPREIASLSREEDLPLALGIVIDISPSQNDLISSHEAAVRHFIEKTVRPGDRAFVVTAAADVILRSEFTGGAHGLRQSLASSVGQPLGVPCGRYANGRPICGGTALWNAVYASARRIARFEGSKALLILSDGNDTGSTHTPEAALEAAQQANASIYAIRYPDSVTGFTESEPMRRMAELTGGLLLRAPAGEPADMLQTIESDLRSRYVIGFYARGDESGVHSIRTELSRPGLNARARRQYVEP